MKRLLSNWKFKILGVYCIVNLLLCFADLQVSTLLFTLIGLGIWIVYNARKTKEYRSALLVWLVLQILVIRAEGFTLDLALPLQLLAGFNGSTGNPEMQGVYFNLVPLPFVYYYFLKDYFKSKES